VRDAESVACNEIVVATLTQMVHVRVGHRRALNRLPGVNKKGSSPKRVGEKTRLMASPALGFKGFPAFPQGE
jgi:hypothetical protein